MPDCLSGAAVRGNPVYLSSCGWRFRWFVPSLDADCGADRREIVRSVGHDFFIPLVAALHILVREDTNRKLEKKQLLTDGLQ